MARHSYNLHPSVPDHNDFLYAPASPHVRLPRRVMFGENIPVRNQSSQGSCSGHAGRTGMMALSFLADDYAPAYLYYEERVELNQTQTDSGSDLRTLCDVLLHQGIAPEPDMRYNPQDYKTPPSAQAIADAAQHKIGSYLLVTDLLTLRTALANRHPVVLGISVYESFEHVGDDGIVPIPKAGEAVLGGHAITALGYEDAHRRIRVQNSWGTTGWGDHGWCWISYDYLMNTNFTFEMRALVP